MSPADWRPLNKDCVHLTGVLSISDCFPIPGTPGSRSMKPNRSLFEINAPGPTNARLESFFAIDRRNWKLLWKYSNIVDSVLLSLSDFTKERENLVYFASWLIVRCSNIYSLTHRRSDSILFGTKFRAKNLFRRLLDNDCKLCGKFVATFNQECCASRSMKIRWNTTIASWESLCTCTTVSKIPSRNLQTHYRSELEKIVEMSIDRQASSFRDIVNLTIFHKRYSKWPLLVHRHSNVAPMITLYVCFRGIAYSRL